MGFFSEYKQVNELLKQQLAVAVYAESRHYYPYLDKLLRDLLEAKTAICYITSDPGDPLLIKAPGGMKVIYVKWMLGFLFSRIRAQVMIMTMPDLGNYLFKRSPGVDHYVYVFHAAVSTHQQYRKNAFIHYDSIFCTGSYQQMELEKEEEMYQQKAKTLVGYGYPLLDEIRRRSGNSIGKQNILVAPSWFDGCIFDTCLEELLEQLAALPYHIILRTHPEYVKRKKKNFKVVAKIVSRYPNMSLDEFPNVLDRLPATDILVTDRSGIAFEFAFGAGKPVLFIDTALKEENPGWRELGIEPVENRLRKELGVSVSTASLSEIPQKIRELEKMQEGFAGKMNTLKRELFFNSEESYAKGLDHILRKLF